MFVSLKTVFHTQPNKFIRDNEWPRLSDIMTPKKLRSFRLKIAKTLTVTVSIFQRLIYQLIFNFIILYDSLRKAGPLTLKFWRSMSFRLKIVNVKQNLNLDLISNTNKPIFKIRVLNGSLQLAGHVTPKFWRSRSFRLKYLMLNKILN